VTLLNDDGPSNGGHEAYRVACRFWPADMRRRMWLDAMTKTDTARNARDAGKRNAKRLPRSWRCPTCTTRVHDRGWCAICRTKRPDGG
jgi:hypothetical protein